MYNCAILCRADKEACHWKVAALNKHESLENLYWKK